MSCAIELLHRLCNTLRKHFFPLWDANFVPRGWVNHEENIDIVSGNIDSGYINQLKSVKAGFQGKLGLINTLNNIQ